ncbi:hypoxanthine phosphoribosyltransferase [Candidatus Epulonipiscium fishelsonii]|uniref:Hypoxanthine phosphoribosyltransferase n=1 Tax=Candidatus Epulonipiscium fishelsonii TaxID=77094 RepID=A0ACC8XG52_9FIRM|nr:hypoxanthine phosphoribosyltransferase [Epulopiscium sp. SCG-B11WGA-EpuloA1]ONI42959.1 hypoxanthine phosphoribosyltransferase [Epulopiscium sp. SCG-B05WGA-EpuloA1]ONI46991.1 hypoxanthine phosphoribosyltransferase [Epulopiscium sp. SCG-C06WGA-EpuloA1]
MLNLETLISEEAIQKRIKELGAQISQDYRNQEIIMLCVLKGSVMFMADLSKRITLPVKMEFMAVSSYGDEYKSSGVVKIVKDLDQPIEGKDILIVEDIIDSGRTLNYLKNILSERNPKSLKICTLLDKPDKRVVDVDVEYIGFTIPDNFVIGYGLDYQQEYRNLPYIAINKE